MIRRYAVRMTFKFIYTCMVCFFVSFVAMLCAAPPCTADVSGGPPSELYIEPGKLVQTTMDIPAGRTYIQVSGANTFSCVATTKIMSNLPEERVLAGQLKTDMCYLNIKVRVPTTITLTVQNDDTKNAHNYSVRVSQ